MLTVLWGYVIQKYLFWPKYDLGIAVVSIIAEVTAQADYVISILEQFELFVQIKLTENYVTCLSLIMLCCSRMSLEHMTDSFSIRAFHQMEFAQDNKKRDMLIRVLFESVPVYSLRHELHLTQHANLDGCYWFVLASCYSEFYNESYFLQHNRFLARTKEREPDVLFVGDSIILQLSLTTVSFCPNYSVFGVEFPSNLYRQIILK